MVDSIIFRNTDSDFPKLLFDDRAKVVDLFLSNNDGEVDFLLSTTLEKHLKQVVYINVLVPVSIGRTLSDFLGLRFATHIRTTPHKNQLSNIFIYSYTGLSDLMGNECFDILNVKGVHFIDFSLSSFNRAIEKRNILMAENQLPIEISKLKLDVPDNYFDNHSVANLWAMHRWSTMMGDLSDSDDELQKIKTKVYTSIYFKYLKTLHRTNQLESLDLNQLKIGDEGNILLIDDEANKGWYEIFCTLLVDNNDGIEMDYIDDDKFHGKSQKEIIEICINEIKQIKDYPDVIILDLRLHPLDFETVTISELTGFKILKEIKKLNPGIQVIIFSATNKVWNLQALLNEGADGFIIKESLINSSDSNFTSETIVKFIDSVNTCLDRKFLKKVVNTCDTIKNKFVDEYIDEDCEYMDFISDSILQINLIKSLALKINLKDSMTLDVVFLNCYNFLEKFKHHYLREENYQIVLGFEEVEMNRYSVNRGIVTNCGRFIRDNRNDSPSWFNCLAGLFIDYFGIANLNDEEIKRLNKVKNLRNDYIHSSKEHFENDELLMILDLCANATSGVKE